jgi:hypothetical protein
MIPIPLSVRIKTSKTDRHITREVRRLTFRSTIPGGFASATMDLDRPLILPPDDVVHFATVWVYDTRSGDVVWQGRVEDLGRASGPDGEVWQVAAVGSSAHARDRALPLIYVDAEVSPEKWPRSAATKKSAQIDYRDKDDEGKPSVVLYSSEGEIIPGSAARYAEILYRAMYDAGLKIARIRCDVINAVTNADYGNRILTRQGPSGTVTTLAAAAWTSGGTFMQGSLGGSNAIPSGHDVASIHWARLIAGDFAAQSDNYVGEYSGIAVRCQLKDKSGNDITSGYDLNSVLASEVVADLLGRMLPKYDGANATVATTTHNIEHLAYPDGTTAADVLDDLMAVEIGHYWAAWDGTPAKFEWRAWPSTVRYEADVTGGFEAPGSGGELYNEALVRYRDWRNRVRTTTRTQTVPELTDAGLTRTLLTDVGDNISALASAQKHGDDELSEHQTVQNAGRLTVVKPILDRDKGMLVNPWEIRPGHLIRVRGISPSIDSLNASERDGKSVFKVVEVEFDSSTGAANLTLDSHSRSVARMLASLAKRKSKRRR